MEKLMEELVNIGKLTEELMNVYLVQHLCNDGSYEVVAITSTEEKAFEAMKADYCRKMGYEPGHVTGKCVERHGYNFWTETLYQNRVEFGENGFVDFEPVGERRYAIACCVVDNPYWFRKEA